MATKQIVVTKEFIKLNNGGVFNTSNILFKTLPAQGKLLVGLTAATDTNPPAKKDCLVDDGFNYIGNENVWVAAYNTNEVKIIVEGF